MVLMYNTAYVYLNVLSLKYNISYYITHYVIDSYTNLKMTYNMIIMIHFFNFFKNYI